MAAEYGTLQPEDYIEPRCVLCGDPYGKTPEVKSVPQDRIIQKLDEYMSRRDYEGAGRHLNYWLEEALLGNDLRGELVIRNELVGHYRKEGKEKEALENAEKALELLDRLGFEGTISSGTTYINAATANHAFGKYQTALELFEKARNVYEANENIKPELLGGLYNNMGLTLCAIEEYEEALKLYEKALEQMKKVPAGELEQAVTYLNMADAVNYEKGSEQAQEQTDEWLETAFSLLDTPDVPRDGYYAFVCEKCAPVFSYYGYFLQAQDLEGRAKAIYERD